MSQKTDLFPIFVVGKSQAILSAPHSESRLPWIIKTCYQIKTSKGSFKEHFERDFVARLSSSPDAPYRRGVLAMWVPRQPHRLLPTSPRYLRLHTDSRSCRVPAIGGAFSSLAARFSLSRTRLETNDCPSDVPAGQPTVDDMSGRRKKGIVKRITLGKVDAKTHWGGARTCAGRGWQGAQHGGVCAPPEVKVPTSFRCERVGLCGPVCQCFASKCAQERWHHHRDVCASTAPALSLSAQQLEPFCVFRTHASWPLDSIALPLGFLVFFSMPLNRFYGFVQFSTA